MSDAIGVINVALIFGTVFLVAVILTIRAYYIRRKYRHVLRKEHE